MEKVSMNWFELMNQATSYIEKHITEDINLKEVASHCGVSYAYFSKTFSLITGYTLKEYIRNRRITLASYDVSNTNERIVDIALKYGYRSNEAFTRAFHKIHGINPKEARTNKVTIYTHFPVLHYDIPKPNIISLRYEIISNIDQTFIGKRVYIVEDNYEETQAFQKEFMDTFKSEHPSTHTLYRVHHHLSYDNLKYDYLVGYDQKDYDHPSLETLHIKADKAVRFISTHTKKELIPNIKTIINTE